MRIELAGIRGTTSNDAFFSKRRRRAQQRAC
jgi:hypothetical protein